MNRTFDTTIPAHRASAHRSSNSRPHDSRANGSYSATRRQRSAEPDYNGYRDSLQREDASGETVARGADRRSRVQETDRAAYQRARRGNVDTEETVQPLGNVYNFEDARRQRDELRREVERRERERRERDLAGDVDDLDFDARDSRRAEHIARYERKKQKEAEHQAKMAEKRKNCPACHWGLSMLTLLLLCISMPIIYSASMPEALASNHSPTYFVMRQAFFALVGYGVFVGVSKLKPAQMRVGLWVLYFAVLVGLAAMAFTPLGVVQSGVKRWIKIPGLPPQQLSEFAKIAMIGVMADFWSRSARAAQHSNWPFWAAAGLTVPVAGLVLIQPHLSATLLLCALPLFIAWFADVPSRRIATVIMPIVAVLALGGFLAVQHKVPFMPEYMQERIAAKFGGNADAQGSNYQTLQSQRTLVSGGLLGRGPGQSLGKQGHLPEAHTDFIFAVIGEEYGLAGAMTLLGCYGLLIFFCFQIGHVAETMFEALLCAGVGTLMAVQVICNIGVATGALPVTGMPLPFMSYGGSGLLCVLLGLGLVLGVSRGLGRSLADAERAEEDLEEGSLPLQDYDRHLQPT